MNSRWLRRLLVTGLVLLILGCASPAGTLTGPRLASAQTGAPNATSGVKLYVPLVLSYYDGILPPFGVESTDWGTTDAAGLAGQLRQTGATWTRVHALKWRDVQPQAGGPYNWSVYDAWLAALSQKGLTPLLTIAYNPDWASVDPVNLPSGPIKSEHVVDFAKFVQATVARYSQPPYNVNYFELYNEPDGTSARAYYGGIIGTWGNDGAQYAAMLRAVYPAVKAVNPHAQVVFGGLAYSGFTPTGPFVQKFLDDVLAAGGGAYFDVLNFHYYTPQAAQWGAYGTDILGKVNYLRQKLAAYGWAKPVIVSEAGEFGPVGDPAKEENQAQYVPKVYARGISAGLLSVIWYSLQGGTNGTGLTENGVFKPAYGAYQTAAAVLANRRLSRQLSAQDVSPNPAAPVSSFEGYAFRVPGGKEDLWVVWLNQGSAAIAVRKNTVEVIDKFNNRTTLHAGADGLVRLTLTTSPLYLRF